MAFWRPGTVAPGSTLDRASEAEGSLTLSSANKHANLGLQAQREYLPIYKHRQRLLWMVERYQVTIVVGQTGCGKTTQLPQYLMEAGWARDGNVIACTQPRRVAATSVAARVSEEVGCVLGDEVGYTIRFEDLSSPTRTRIKYMTDGMLFRETLVDPLLSKYSVIMIDEAHERNAYTDLLLGVLKKILPHRPSLRLIISSATLTASKFRTYFNLNPDPSSPDADTASVISLEGRMFPVEVAYTREAVDDYVRAAVEVVVGIHKNEGPGDILVFLTGREEIDTALEEISDLIPTFPRNTPRLAPVPLHAGLTNEEQLRVFAPPPPGTRKVVFATNIAEASVTIDGIKFVVDCAFVKLRVFNPHTSIESLSIVPCSHASLTQRAGRAGRTSPGKCFRLFPESALRALPRATPPEIARSDLSLFVLQLKALGIDNILRFDYLDPPPSEMMVRALEFLYALGALDEYGRLTRPLGARMAEVPVEPMLAKILLDSPNFQCTEEILSIAAMTAVQNVFVIGEGQAGALGELERRKFTAEEGDHLTLLNVFNAFTRTGQKSAKWAHAHRLNFKALSRAVSIRAQLVKYLQRFGIATDTSCEGDHRRLRRCLVSGYFKNAARWSADGTYRSVREGAVLHVHPSSVLFTRTPSTKYVIYHEVIETTKTFIRDLTVIEPEWLPEIASHYYQVSGGTLPQH